MTQRDDAGPRAEGGDEQANGSRGRAVFALAIGLAIVALALGLWDVLVERDAGSGPFVQLAFPVGLLILVFILYRRAGRRSE